MWMAIPSGFWWMRRWRKTKRCAWFPDMMWATMRTAQNILSLGLIILFIVLTAFLLIHNIMGMTVSQQIRFFGQLKTLGTTIHTD